MDVSYLPSLSFTGAVVNICKKLPVAIEGPKLGSKFCLIFITHSTANMKPVRIGPCTLLETRKPPGV